MGNEASKIRDRILHILQGKTVLDLGCGDEKVVPWAVGVDDASEWATRPAAIDVESKIDPSAGGLREALARAGKPTGFEVVFSSHALEHLPSHPSETLRYWNGFANIGGTLVVYLPDERLYKYDPANPSVRNPAHRHLLTKPWIDDILAAEPLLYVLSSELRNGPGEYSVLVIARRVA